MLKGWAQSLTKAEADGSGNPGPCSSVSVIAFLNWLFVLCWSFSVKDFHMQISRSNHKKLNQSHRSKQGILAFNRHSAHVRFNRPFRICWLECRTANLCVDLALAGSGRSLRCTKMHAAGITAFSLSSVSGLIGLALAFPVPLKSAMYMASWIRQKEDEST